MNINRCHIESALAARCSSNSWWLKIRANWHSSRPSGAHFFLIRKRLSTSQQLARRWLSNGKMLHPVGAGPASRFGWLLECCHCLDAGYWRAPISTASPPTTTTTFSPNQCHQSQRLGILQCVCGVEYGFRKEVSLAKADSMREAAWRAHGRPGGQEFL